MKKLKTILAVLLAAITLCSVLYVPVTADEESLPLLLNSYFQKQSLNGNNISVAYYNTVSGEEFLWNSDDYYIPASIYKLPLNMYYYEQEAAGFISSDKKFAGYPLSICHKLSLQYSNNPTSEAMQSALGIYRPYKTLMAKYGGIPEDSLPDVYYTTSKYTSRFILNTLKYMYDRQGFFSEAIQYLKDAQPRRWFERTIPDSECIVAQKYGSVQYKKTAFVHTAGIVYADEPFLLVVFTKGLSKGERVIGDVARICYDYTRANVGSWRETVSDFEDVYTTDWYADSVLYCTQSGIALGMGNGHFEPERSCTGAEIITFLWRSVGKPEAAVTAPFSVQPWFQDAIDWAYSEDIIDVSFLPDAPCTRAETVNYMWKAAGSPSTSTGSIFFDVPEEYHEAVSWAVERDIIKGTDENSFSPYKSCSRAEIVTIIYRAHNSEPTDGN